MSAPVNIDKAMRNAVSALHGAADDGADTRRYADELHAARLALVGLIAADRRRDSATVRLHEAVLVLIDERDALRAVLREFQDARRIRNPHTRQVARDIEQQALARSRGAEASSPWRVDRNDETGAIFLKRFGGQIVAEFDQTPTALADATYIAETLNRAEKGPAP